MTSDPAAHAGDGHPLLAATHLRVALTGAVVLDGIDLTLQQGELAWLEGPNGAGKTTLLRALAGLVASDGDVRVFGAPAGSAAARARVRFVPDIAPLYEDLTVREHADFLGRVSGRPEADRLALEWCGRFGLRDQLDQYPGTLSRGMRQKLALAVALGGAPPLLLLDEPFNALDADAQERLLEGLVDHATAGGAALLSGHQLELAARWPGRRIRLQAGSLAPARA
jgi:ABC-2 type transport system ATP-binding protein